MRFEMLESGRHLFWAPAGLTGPHISLLIGAIGYIRRVPCLAPATAAMQATAAVQAFLPATRGAARPAGRQASSLRLMQQQQQRQMIVLRALGGEWLA